MKKIWDFLNGKKTTIGMLLVLLAQGSQAFFPQLMSVEQINFLYTTGALIGGVGVLHKGAKTETGQNLLTKIKQKKN